MLQCCAAGSRLPAQLDRGVPSMQLPAGVCGRVSTVQLIVLLLFACRYALPDFQRDEEGRIRLPGAPSAYFPR